MDISDFIVPSDKNIRLKDYDPDFTGKYKDRGEATEKLARDVLKLAELQDVLYANNRHALLLVFQAMDAAGKDSTIKHVMSGINPQGCLVYSFKKPSSEELDHDYLWRCMKVAPERGRIGIFNRSYYEEVLVTRVHPEFLEYQMLPEGAITKNIYKERFEDINNYEKYLCRNGIHVVKFFLNVSRKEQKRRFLERIERDEKNWKFSEADAKERELWDDYMEAYEDMFNHTSTDYAPWHIMPANNKWFTRTAVADVIVKKLKSLDLKYPEISKEQKKQLLEIKERLQEG